jgi:hypothetical protein
MRDASSLLIVILRRRFWVLEFRAFGWRNLSPLGREGIKDLRLIASRSVVGIGVINPAIRVAIPKCGRLVRKVSVSSDFPEHGNFIECAGMIIRETFVREPEGSA